MCRVIYIIYYYNREEEKKNKIRLDYNVKTNQIILKDERCESVCVRVKERERK